MKCDRCGRKGDLASQFTQMGDTKERLRIVCLNCKAKWLKIFDEKIEHIKNSKEQNRVWVEEYEEFMRIIKPEKVQFT